MAVVRKWWHMGTCGCGSEAQMVPFAQGVGLVAHAQKVLFAQEPPGGPVGSVYAKGGLSSYGTISVIGTYSANSSTPDHPS